MVKRAAQLRRAERERVKAAVSKLHSPWGIYDECGHDHRDEAEPDVVDVAEVGLTCKAGLMYQVCSACCVDGSFEMHQTEECVSAHKHGTGEPLCPTDAVLREIR
jgi:hypothetical protein